MRSFLAYYHESRTHLSLGKDTPEARTVQPRNGEPSLRYPKWVVFTTGMSDAQLERGSPRRNFQFEDERTIATAGEKILFLVR